MFSPSSKGLVLSTADTTPVCSVQCLHDASLTFSAAAVALADEIAEEDWEEEDSAVVRRPW